jgi:hypothetical protein
MPGGRIAAPPRERGVPRRGGTLEQDKIVSQPVQ